MDPFPTFKAALLSLGQTKKECAERLAITPRQLSNWLANGPPPRIQALPEVVLEAVIQDKKLQRIQDIDAEAGTPDVAPPEAGQPAAEVTP